MAITVTDGELSITPEGETALSLMYLREQIADSSIWRAIVAEPRSVWADVKAVISASRAGAINAIYFDRIDDAGLGQLKGEELPFCFIRPWDEWTASWAATSSWDIDGMILMTFEIPVPTSYRESVRLATIDFWNKIDGIINDVQTVGASMQAERIQPQISRVILPGELDPKDNNGRHVRRAAYSVTVNGVR